MTDFFSTGTARSARDKYQVCMHDLLGIGVYTCDITWSVIMKQHRAQTNAQYQYACLSLEVCFDVMVYGRRSVIMKQHMARAKTQY